MNKLPMTMSSDGEVYYCTGPITLAHLRAPTRAVNYSDFDYNSSSSSSPSSFSFSPSPLQSSSDLQPVFSSMADDEILFYFSSLLLLILTPCLLIPPFMLFMMDDNDWSITKLQQQFSSFMPIFQLVVGLILVYLPTIVGLMLSMYSSSHLLFDAQNTAVTAGGGIIANAPR